MAIALVRIYLFIRMIMFGAAQYHSTTITELKHFIYSKIIFLNPDKNFGNRCNVSDIYSDNWRHGSGSRRSPALPLNMANITFSVVLEMRSKC